MHQKICLSCKKLSNQNSKRTANTACCMFAIQEEQLSAECGTRLNNFYLSNLLCIFSLLFSQKISTKDDITSTEISYQFLALKVPVLRRNKATNSSTSTDPFSAATKTLVLGNLFKFERFAITFARAFCHWG